MRGGDREAAEARELIYAAAGLTIGRAALAAIGAPVEEEDAAVRVRALSDAEALRIAEALRAELERRVPGAFRGR